MALLFVIVQVIAIAIAPIYSAAESDAMGGRETIENPAFAFCYLGVILVFTFIILYIAKKKKEKFIKYLILAAIFMTMVYLFVPLTIEALDSDSQDGWNENEIGFAAVVINVGDVDNDGVLEVVAGCADNVVRIYETENHTLEWESGDLGVNITEILIGNYDTDDSTEFVVLAGTATVFNGSSKSVKWNSTSNDLAVIWGADLNGNGTFELMVGDPDNPVIEVIAEGTISDSIDLSSNLNKIEYLGATDSGKIAVADNTTIVVLDPQSHAIELEITALDNIRALAVYNNPLGEDLIIAADNKGPYVFGLAGGKHLRKDTDISNIRGIYFEEYDIPGAKDEVPEILVVTDDFIYIYPDLIKSDPHPWFLRLPDEQLGFYTTDLENDGKKDILLGVEEGYIYTPITFAEGSLPIIPLIISITAALLLTIVVQKFPEWYVVDTVGLVMAIGAVVILGVTFAILPAIALLAVLAVYDAISVYKTKHMITLADSVIDLNLPVLLVIPKKLHYSYRKEKPRLKEQIKEGTEREAMFMGLGDIVIPSLLIISALTFLPSSSSTIGITNNILVAIGTMIGILIGFSVLMRYVLKGNPQAGLPLLNSGAIGGYIITYILVFGDLAFGFNLNFM
jgi:presenilin-like A22 family membrane protease